MLFAFVASLVFLFQPTTTPQPTPAPGIVYSHLVLAFYYPWYGTPDGPGGKSRNGAYVHWEGVNAGKREIDSSTHYPSIGAYDSHDPRVTDAHCAEAAAAGIDAFIISWWGKDSFEDQAVPTILDSCARHHITACIYYEQVARPGTPESVAAELTDLSDRYAAHAAYLKVSDHGVERPVVFIYARALHQLGVPKWKDVYACLEKRPGPRPFIIADDFGDASLTIFDGAHTYAPMGDLNAAARKGEAAEQWAARAYPWWTAHPRARGKLACATVFPGYDDTKIRTPGMKVDRNDGKLYAMLWRHAVDARPDWVLITSFNEWHEGSEIEPSDQYSDKYLDLTRTWARRFKEARH